MTTAIAQVPPANRLQIVEWTNHYRIGRAGKVYRDAYVREPNGVVRLWALPESVAA